MEVTAKYELIGLMAYPIRHSLSPTMQNCALEKMGLPICYMAFEVDNASFPDAIKGLRALKMRGTGVSMPNKQLAIEYVDELDPAAELAGAINTIVNKDGRLIGYNTDGTGHLHGIKETGFDPKGKTMVLVGAGGAATAIGARAAVEGFKEVKLFNRKDEFWEGAHAFAKRVNEKTDCVVTVHDLDDTAAFRAAIDSADVLTNATKVGMKPLHELSVVGDASWLRPGLVVSECVYNPHITKLLTQMLRASAAHQPGILSEIGLGTFVDPRNQGGKLNDITKEDLISLVNLEGKEYLYYKTVAPNVAFIRATTCDSEGYATFEDEVMYLDALVIAEAVHNNGGIVMMQVQKMVKKATLHPKAVRIPGYLVDIVVVDPAQTQLYGGAPVNRFISGDFTLDDSERVKIPLNQRKVVARRALYEMKKGAIGNVGVGIADGIGLVAREEGCDEDFVLTVETGPIGGITTQGVAFGANVNTRAILDMTAQFDFYHGGGLDVCYLSFAEVDQHGNVNVHKFNGKIMGTGGFIDISATSRKIVFCGTLTAGGLKTEVGEGSLRITQEGRVTKFVESLPEITFSGKVALERGLDVRYITERAVFTLKEDGLHLIEVAPGVDIERDVCSKMAFRPIIDENLKTMDPCLFTDAVMGFKLPDGE